ncbi:MAG TPA: DUF3786 domain-containing protein [Dehalococcoidia bacterium]|jgi:hypothetical protein|nr:DUF3786 domain-containing protein [Dehalococcoidia bacterium]
MPLDAALQQALRQMEGIAPLVTANKSGCPFAQGRFLVPFFNRRFYIYHPRGRVEEMDNPQPPPPYLQLVLLHYLLTADGTAVADSWVTYRFLPGAELFGQRFQNLVNDPLNRLFGNDLDGFRRAGAALGGRPMSRAGDAAFRFLAFPRLPVACILYLGDEEVAGSVNFLFDASAPHYLPTEDLTVVASYLVGAMARTLGRSP